MSRLKKPVNPLVERLRRKIKQMIVRELIDTSPEFRANAQSVVEDWNFPRVCGDANCSRANACARDLECYVLTHRNFGKLVPRMQEALGRSNAAA